MTDFLIIGGGVAGLSLAAELAPHGAVTVMEAEDQLAYHASGRSAAAFVPGYGNDVIRALTDASEDYFEDNALLTQRGMMLLARAGQDAAFEEEIKGFELTEISLDAAIARVPLLRRETVTRVATKDTVWDIDTDALVQGYARKAMDAGAEIVTNARVQSISRSAAHWVVKTDSAEFKAPIVVNAAGAWADAIAEVAGLKPLGITPLRRSMARVPAPEGIDVSNWPFLDGVGEGWYAKPDAGALIVSPADEDPVAPMDAWAEDMTLAEGIARCEEMVELSVTRMLSNWAGLRSFAPDRTPVLGEDTGGKGFFWCAAQGGYGFQTAPGAARLMADIILGRPSSFDAGLRAKLGPARFD